MLPPIAAARLLDNIWSSGGGDALSPADIAAAFADGLQPMTGRESGYSFAAGVDLGVSRDFSAIVILAIPAKKSGKVRLAQHRLWRPAPGKKVDLQEVQDCILELDAQYALERVGVDPWNAELLCSQLEASSQHRARNARRRQWTTPWIKEIPPNASNLRDQTSLILQYFGDHRIELFDCPPLARDLMKLRCEEKATASV